MNEKAELEADFPGTGIFFNKFDLIAPVIMEKAFAGSLPKFVASFLDGKTLSDKEAEALKRLIESHKEE